MFTPSEVVRPWSRRDVLRVGAAAFGLSLPALLRCEQTQAARPGKPKAKSVIILYLSGGHSQLDTFDPKPDAPDDIRGPFTTIKTKLPGVIFSELVPHCASCGRRRPLSSASTAPRSRGRPTSRSFLWG